jgi:hypothetical protein
MTLLLYSVMVLLYLIRLSGLPRVVVFEELLLRKLFEHMILVQSRNRPRNAELALLTLFELGTDMILAVFCKSFCVLWKEGLFVFTCENDRADVVLPLCRCPAPLLSVLPHVFGDAGVAA